MRFWDTSALIPLCVDEPQTRSIRLLREEDPEIRVWWGTRVECYATLARRVREGLGGALEAIGHASLRALFERVDEVGPAEDVRLRAERLLAVHPLRAADAFQLAAALVWSRERPAGLGLVCLDQRLREAGAREGFAVLP